MSIQPKYSVIIPIYNREATLARCVESLLSESREDVQILLVDDGSTDKSAEIATVYADQYSQVQYYYKENGGVSSARNFGLDLAKGQYITFIDSDDYVNPGYFSNLDAAEDCDLLVFAHSVLGGNIASQDALFSLLESKETFIERLQLLLSSRQIMPPWNKRFQRSIIDAHHLRFLEGMQIGEDFNFCMAYAMHCRQIGISSAQIVCNDITDQDSLSRKYRPRLDLQMLDVFEHVAQTIQNSPQPDNWKAQLLAIADYLFIKNVFSGISEEFKQKKLSYIKDRKQIAEICDTFQHPLSDMRINLIHRALRWMLAWKIYDPFYLVSYWVKGRKYQH